MNLGLGYEFENPLDLQLTNHPVHILSENNQISQSAFIPFCDFGGNISSVGVKIDQFDVHICNSFQAKVLNDQLCYEVDLNRFSNPNNKQRELKLGFNFIMDFNEDRQVTFDKDLFKRNETGWANNIAESNSMQNALIYLNTIGGSGAKS